MASSKENAELQEGHYDFVQLSVADFNGGSRGKLVPGRHVHDLLKNHGSDLPYEVIVAGPCGEVPRECMELFVGKDCGNTQIKVLPETLHAAPWLNRDGSHVGEVLGEWLSTETANIGELCPRSLARRQISKLSKYGAALYSGFESELIVLGILNAPDREHPLGNSAMSFFQSFIQKIDKYAYKAGVDIQAMYKERSHEAIEFVLAPTKGIKSADDFFVLKHAIKSTSFESGYLASFMTKLVSENAGNYSHINLSLIDEITDENIFYDPNAEFEISEIGRQFIAGLVENCEALCAICYSTVNCYRRVVFTPTHGNWGFEDRDVSFRVKKYKNNAIVIENRLASGPSNPYLVMAATLAAGLDGIERRLQAPIVQKTEAKILPKSLDEALDHLKNSKVMRKALGDRFVDAYVSFKKEIEVAYFNNEDYRKMSEREATKTEIAYYNFSI